MKASIKKATWLAGATFLASAMYAQIPNPKKAVQSVKESAQQTQNNRDLTSGLNETNAQTTITSAISGNLNETGNSNTILFSKTPINPLNPQNLTRSFVAGDYIYGLALFPKSVSEMARQDDPYKLEVMISYEMDEDFSNTTTGTLSAEAVQRNYIAFEFVANPETVVESYTNPDFKFKKYPNPPACDGPIRVADDMRQWPSGKHTVSLKMHLNYQPVITGEFTIEGNDFSVYKNIRDQIIAAADRGAAASATMPAAKMNDKETEAQMLAAFQNSNDWKTGRIKAKETLKIAIVDPDWTIRRHEITGAILHRYIRAAIAVKTSEGQCGIYKLVTFQQDYTGNQFQPLKYDGAGDFTPVDCANIK